MGDLRFRPAGMDDIEAIVGLHLRVWRHAMRDLAPPAAYAALDEDYRADQWTRMLSAQAEDDRWLLAEIDGRAVGIGGACAPSHAAFGDRGEIRFLYVDQAVQRRGIGRGLMSRLAGHLIAHGYRRIALSVVEGNAPALAFYAALGGKPVGTHIYPSAIWPSTDVVIAWDDEPSLAALASP